MLLLRMCFLYHQIAQKSEIKKNPANLQLRVFSVGLIMSADCTASLLPLWIKKWNVGGQGVASPGKKKAGKKKL